MKNIILTLGVAAFAFQVAGCGTASSKSANCPTCKTQTYTDGESTRNLPIGKGYAATPPRLVREDVAWDSNKGQRVAWNSTKAFGPVPANLKAKGAATCRSVGATFAKGYHPRAQGLNGQPLAGGAFLCG